MPRFEPGNNGGPGRPKGSKNKLQEAFWQDFVAAWEKHGQTALNHIASNDQSTFVKVAASLMPKDIQLEIEKRYVVRAPEPLLTDQWQQKHETTTIQ